MVDASRLRPDSRGWTQYGVKWSRDSWQPIETGLRRWRPIEPSLRLPYVYVHLALTLSTTNCFCRQNAGEVFLVKLQENVFSVH